MRRSIKYIARYIRRTPSSANFIAVMSIGDRTLRPARVAVAKGHGGSHGGDGGANGGGIENR